MRESWTDERLDDFRSEVNRRFDEASADVNRRFDEAAAEVNRRFDEAAADVNRRFDEAAAEVNRRFDEVHRELRTQRAETAAFRIDMGGRFERLEARIDDVNRTMMRFGFGAIVTFVVGFGGMIATQL